MMKKAIKINLSGIIFHIDEDAYEKLKKYLDAISRHFSNKAEGKEILNDIEARIAELFQEKQDKDNEVVNIEMVLEVIEIMGDPKEFIDADDESQSSENKHYTYSETQTGSRRLHRDPEQSVFGGVCGGLGAYFNIDPLIFRVLFLVFFFAGGASFIVYIILWIVLPKAETAAQKLEMRGEPVNVNNIEKKVREEYDNAKENVKKAANSEQVKKTKTAASNFFQELGKILLVFIKVLLIIIGTAFVISGIGILIALISGTFVGMHVFPFGDYDFSLGDMLAPFTDPVNITMLIIGLTLLFIIPVIAMIYGLIKLIFSIKTRNKGLGIGAGALWVVSLLMVVGIIVIESNNYSSSGRSESVSPLSFDSDTLFVKINNDQEKDFEKDLAFNFENDSEWFITEDLDRIYGRIDLDIEKSNNDKFKLEIEKKSKGKSWDEAKANASKLNYNFKTKGNVIILDPYFFMENEEKWRFPDVNLTLKVPEGKYIHLEKNTRKVLDDVYNTDHVSDYRMGEKTWYMEERGLKLISK